jgi:hypothetical protein
MQVDINTEQPVPENLVTIDTNQTTAPLPLSAELASERAYKAQFAVPQKTYDDYYQSFVNGREGEVRQETAANIDVQKYEQRSAALRDYFSRYGTMSPEEKKFVEDKVAINNLVGIKKTDPDSVFEEFYSGNYLKSIYDIAQKKPDIWLADAIRDLPKEVKDNVNEGSKLVSRREWLQTKAQDLQEVWDKQGWTDVLGIAIPTSMVFRCRLH